MRIYEDLWTAETSNEDKEPSDSRRTIGTNYVSRRQNCIETAMSFAALGSNEATHAGSIPAQCIK
jgi:hypothetical protein